ncbi:MAG: FtsX-like permease family protein [Bacteroidota bacterium]|nr:FtsX-like permease family protein [Bacteroidota bacterium]
MNFPFYIARRYLVSRKTHNIINIISGVSVAGVTIGTMALIIVLSVFNGFEKLVVSLFNAFNPDMVITPAKGKTFDINTLPLEEIRKIPGVIHLSQIIEENALLRYKDKQYIATIKGVEAEYTRMSRLDTLMTDGKFLLQEGDRNYAVLGNGVAYYLGADMNDYVNPIEVYVPLRNSDPGAGLGSGLENAFNMATIFPAGFFSVQEEFDIKYVILPIRFVRQLLDYHNEITGVEIGIMKGANADKIQKQIGNLAGERFVIKNRYQQQEMLYKIMKSEKWAIFLILAFILLIATFNVIGSLSMVILDKKQDIAILQCLGASQRTVKRIFMTEGWLISIIGAIAGLILGAGACYLQMRFGFVKLGSAESTFVVNTYPVNMQLQDFIFVFLTVLLIGLAAAWYPVYNIRKIDTHILNQRS